ncbi:hypothetical protein LCGC14_1965400 [marine sediment metagenome]|uniref:Uncharacterized protein n=1 Tax=marine sediment metagenome TaxID=412755 RepID=A0A0F9IAD4_9ZZZZ
MPYTIENPPEAIEMLPKHAIEIWVSAFNAAFKQYNGDEGKSAGTAWAAVKMKYKKVGDKWVAKEAKMLSDKNKSKLLQAALVTEYKIGQSTPIPKNLTIDEVFDNKVIYDVDGQLYESSYELDEDGKITFSDPKKVLGTKVYKAMEAKRKLEEASSFNINVEVPADFHVPPYTVMDCLQEKYSEIIQEAGKRNASLDSTRLKKIVELCQELLSSEVEHDEKEVKKITQEADAALVWIKTQEAMRTEDGIQYPAAAFAYVLDREKASSWKLRMWEDPEKKVTKAQLSRVAAALSPGGFRGQKADVPSADLSAVKRKVRAEYRKLDVDEADIPRWVKETLTRELVQNFVPLTEATFDKGRATVIVIKPGFNSDKSRYYPVEMLKRDYKVFEGQKMYADHPTETEEKELPERSIKNTGWVAVLKDVSCDEAGIVTGVAEIIEPWLMTKLATLRDKEMLPEMGISINAIGEASKATIDGVETLVIEKLTGSRSVDFVTEPGASGIVTMYESDRSRDVDLVELSGLKERRPDLIKAIEANIRSEITKEVKKAMENEELIKEKDEQIEALTKERDGLKEAAEKAEKDKAKAEAQATIKEAVDKAELPDAAKERLVERFKDAESADGIEEAIKSEVDYIAKLSEAGKVKGFGDTKVNPEKDKEALRESFKKANPEWTDAQIEIAVNGR